MLPEINYVAVFFSDTKKLQKNKRNLGRIEVIAVYLVVQHLLPDHSLKSSVGPVFVSKPFDFKPYC